LISLRVQKKLVLNNENQDYEPLPFLLCLRSGHIIELDFRRSI
jgi:hypothetical protein